MEKKFSLLAPIRAMLQRAKRVIEIYRHEAEIDASLPECTYQMLIRKIVGAVREKAHATPEYQGYHDGCIRITVVPLSVAADRWLSGLSSRSTWLEGGEKDVCEQEFVFKLDLQGSHTAFNDGVPVNCYSYSAMKTAYTSYKYRMRHSFEEPYEGCFTEENGWSKEKGSVCTTITVNGRPFIRLYVSVHSDKDLKADEACALYGMRMAQVYIAYHADAATFSPIINDRLERDWFDGD